jgi:hypothetical protein
MTSLLNFIKLPTGLKVDGGRHTDRRVISLAYFFLFEGK